MQQTHTATSTSSCTLCLGVYFIKHTHAVEFLTSLGCFMRPSNLTEQFSPHYSGLCLNYQEFINSFSAHLLQFEPGLTNKTYQYHGIMNLSK